MVGLVLWLLRRMRRPQIDRAYRDYQSAVRHSDSVANGTYGQMGRLPFSGGNVYLGDIPGHTSITVDIPFGSRPASPPQDR